MAKLLVSHFSQPSLRAHKAECLMVLKEMPIWPNTTLVNQYGAHELAYDRIVSLQNLQYAIANPASSSICETAVLQTGVL